MQAMDRRSAVPVGSGFWKGAGPAQYSKETQELLKVMMQESKLTNFQQRQLRTHLQRGDALPTECPPTSSDGSQTLRRPSSPAEDQRFLTGLPSRPGLRPAEICRAGDAYSRDRFRPQATKDQEKEKRRLQNILATGKDLPEVKQNQLPAEPLELESESELDRFDELVAEIQERKQFLEEMEALGQGKKFRNIVETEISQKLREMEIIDRQRTQDLKDKVKSSQQLANESRQ